MQRFNLTRQFFRDVWYLTKSYWQSEEKKKAFFLLGCIIALTLGVVYMLVLLNQWNNSFYSALQNYDAKKIFDELIGSILILFTTNLDFKLASLADNAFYRHLAAKQNLLQSADVR